MGWVQCGQAIALIILPGRLTRSTSPACARDLADPEEPERKNWEGDRCRIVRFRAVRDWQS